MRSVPSHICKPPSEASLAHKLLHSCPHSLVNGASEVPPPLFSFIPPLPALSSPLSLRPGVGIPEEPEPVDLIGKGQFNLWTRFRGPGGGKKINTFVVMGLVSSRPRGQDWQKTHFTWSSPRLLCVHRGRMRLCCSSRGCISSARRGCTDALKQCSQPS